MRELTRADLISLGVPLGRAKKILRVLQPSGSPQPSDPTPTVVGQQPTIKVSVKAIPALGANGFPSRRPWTAYEAVFTAGLGMHQLPVERIKLVSESFLKPSAIIGAGHVDGDFVDQLIWNALATAGPDGMPDELMLAVPLQLRTDRWGLKAVRWISSAVLTSSDDAAGVLQDSFTNCVPVTNKAMLGSALLYLAGLVVEEFQMLPRSIAVGAERSVVLEAEGTRFVGWLAVRSAARTCIRGMVV